MPLGANRIIVTKLDEAGSFGVFLNVSEAGGGSLPTRPFPTWVVVVRLAKLPAATLAAELRQRDVPIICRVHDEALLFDVRTLEPDEAQQISGALAEVVLENRGE